MTALPPATRARTEARTPAFRDWKKSTIPANSNRVVPAHPEGTTTGTAARIVNVKAIWSATRRRWPEATRAATASGSTGGGGSNISSSVIGATTVIRVLVSVSHGNAPARRAQTAAVIA